MEVTIVGWYGTETIGDRAILAGLIHVMSDVFPLFNVRLGSLYPFFTERTLAEDIDYYRGISSHRLQRMTIFDSRCPQQLKSAIKQSDLLMVGGGPLMDLAEMSMLEIAFVYAKKHHVKSLLMGCGWGPLKDERIIQKAVRLIDISDYTVFRDSTSLVQCRQHSDAPNVSSSIDPAFFACHHYRCHIKETTQRTHIAINFRDVALEGTHYAEKAIPETVFVDVVKGITAQTDKIVYLVPMHYFAIGGDDRVILQKIEREINTTQVQTIHNPLGLRETMDMYYHAHMCIGMRFHSVVLQTMLNGNNYIVDYTDPQTGKIVGMIKQLHLEKAYEHRYYSLHSDNPIFKINVNDIEPYKYDNQTIESYKQIYLDVLKKL